MTHDSRHEQLRETQTVFYIFSPLSAHIYVCLDHRILRIFWHRHLQERTVQNNCFKFNSYFATNKSKITLKGYSHMNLRNNAILNTHINQYTHLHIAGFGSISSRLCPSNHCCSHETLLFAPIAIVSEEGNWFWQSHVFSYQPPEIKAINFFILAIV